MRRNRFERLVDRAIEGIPARFRDAMANLAIVVEDEPDPDLLASVHARGLLGLYQGVPRTAYGADHVPLPSKITLFRGPLMRLYRTPDALIDGVRETLDHEVAHHLGISDERLVELRRQRAG